MPDEQCIDSKIWVDTAPGTEMGADVYLREVRVVMCDRDDDVELGLLSPDGVFVNLAIRN